MESEEYCGVFHEPFKLTTLMKADKVHVHTNSTILSIEVGTMLSPVHITITKKTRYHGCIVSICPYYWFPRSYQLG